LQIHIARTLDDIQDVEALARGKTWDHAREFLRKMGDDPFADHLRWLEDDGRPVACVQIFLHQYPVGRAWVGMCLPEYPFVPPELRGRGYFKHLMADLFEWMRGAGYPLAYDHGRKGLYTGRGYAPCFHHCVALIRVDDAAGVRAPARAEGVAAADVADHQDLFRAPYSLGRGIQCRDERWQPDPDAVRVVRSGGEIAGFVVGRPSAGDEVIRILDCWAADVLAAAALLRTLADEAREVSCQWIFLNCRRDDPLARMAVLAGGQLRWWAAQERDWTEKGEDVDAFYLADLRLSVEQLLPELNARWKRAAVEAPPVLRLATDEEQVALKLGDDLTIIDAAASDIPSIRLPRKAMTRAIMGYATPTELSLLHEGCHMPADCRAVADALFVAREPHLIHEEMVFAEPSRWGLVP
jgi:GNAT superfamily N-acetyltransferase